MNNDRNQILGTSFVLLYCLISAASFVFINQIEQTLPPLITAFFSFLISVLICVILTIPQYRTLLQLIKLQLKYVLAINITSVIVWINTFYALKILSPYVMISLFFGVMPIATFLAKRDPNMETTEKYWNILFSFLILIILVSIVVDDLLQISNKLIAFYAVILSITGGIGAAYNNIYARILAQNKFTTLMVLSIRFWFLLIFTAILIKWNGLHFALDWQNFTKMCITALLSVLLPLFCLQQGLKLIDALYVAFLSSLLPVITFFLQLVEPRYHFSTLELILVSLLSLIIFISVYIKFRYAKKAMM